MIFHYLSDELIFLCALTLDKAIGQTTSVETDLHFCEKKKEIAFYSNHFFAGALRGHRKR